MTEREKLQNRTLKCADCGKEFTWEAGSQEYFREMGITSEPKRCEECRRASNHRRFSQDARKGASA
ncbi:MAG: zinc-ribbon domain-containing protein [Acidobacteriota bacterium]|nr:zinc-ribbon domain-containing protein [Acidobacteriota bacterium]